MAKVDKENLHDEILANLDEITNLLESAFKLSVGQDMPFTLCIWTPDGVHVGSNSPKSAILKNLRRLVKEMEQDPSIDEKTH